MRYGVARHSVDLMKLLDDPPRERCHLIFLAQGAMGRRQTDKWIRLALIAEALRRHGRGKPAGLFRSRNKFIGFLASCCGQSAKSEPMIGEKSSGRDFCQCTLRRGRASTTRPCGMSDGGYVDDPVPKSVYERCNESN